MQLHDVVMSGGTVGSVSGMLGDVIANVVPILLMASLSMLQVEFVEGSVILTLHMKVFVLGWLRKIFRSSVIGNVCLGPMLRKRRSMFSGTALRSCSRLLVIVSDWGRRVHYWHGVLFGPFVLQ